MTTEARQSRGENPNADSPERVVRAILLPDTSAQSGLDLPAILRFVRDYWLSIGACAVLGGVAAVAASFAFQPTYRAEVLLAPTSGSNESMGGLGSLIGRYSSLASAVGIGVPGQGGTIPVAIAQLQSRSFIEAFIAEEKIMQALYPGELAPAQSAGKGDGKSLHTLQDGYQRFVRSIMLVKHDKSSDLVTIRIDWEDRELAAKWANALAARLNVVMREDAIEETERSLSYLKAELEKADYVRLKDSISSLMEAQINKRMLALTQPDYAFRVVDPAKPSDANKKVAPKRSIFLVFGFFVGGLLGVLLGLRRLVRKNSMVASAP